MCSWRQLSHLKPDTKLCISVNSARRSSLLGSFPRAKSEQAVRRAPKSKWVGNPYYIERRTLHQGTASSAPRNIPWAGKSQTEHEKQLTVKKIRENSSFKQKAVSCSTIIPLNSYFPNKMMSVTWIWPTLYFTGWQAKKYRAQEFVTELRIEEQLTGQPGCCLISPWCLISQPGFVLTYLKGLASHC